MFWQIAYWKVVPIDILAPVCDRAYFMAVTSTEVDSFVFNVKLEAKHVILMF
jgi:hypothetical protein